MPTRVRLFISAGPDQDAEREILGRALAELPLSVGWIIKRTPDIDSVAECHLFALVLGSDIVAPVGLELWWARRTEKPIRAYRTAALHTPAATVFLQDNSAPDWRRFADATALRRHFLLDVGRFLTTHPDRYGIGVMETEMLRAFLANLETSAPAAMPGTATGAGGGGVILAPGKDVPFGARVVGEDPP